ncbi:hypothetical protein V2J09_011020 [Rumex salicifolius]
MKEQRTTPYYLCQRHNTHSFKLRFLHRLIRALNNKFAMSDLKTLRYFLGIFVTKTESGLHLSEEKYTNEILQ